VLPAHFAKIALIIAAASEALQQYARNWRKILLCFAIFLLVVLSVCFSIAVVPRRCDRTAEHVRVWYRGTLCHDRQQLPFRRVRERSFTSACGVLKHLLTIGLGYDFLASWFPRDFDLARPNSLSMYLLRLSPASDIPRPFLQTSFATPRAGGFILVYRPPGAA
jgi:hypothetical protein